MKEEMNKLHQKIDFWPNWIGFVEILECIFQEEMHE